MRLRKSAQDIAHTPLPPQITFQSRVLEENTLNGALGRGFKMHLTNFSLFWSREVVQNLISSVLTFFTENKVAVILLVFTREDGRIMTEIIYFIFFSVYTVSSAE